MTDSSAPAEQEAGTMEIPLPGYSWKSKTLFGAMLSTMLLAAAALGFLDNETVWKVLGELYKLVP